MQQQQQQQYYYFSSNNPNPINNSNSNSNNNSIFYPENDITNINSFSKLDDDNNNIDYDDDNDDDPACSSNNFLHFNNFPNSPQMFESYESVYLQFYDLFHQQPQSENTPNNMVITSTDLNHENDAAPDAKKTKGRCSKKDRHSKIITASGPRDRRMRLSLDVARRFFQLQDILGYDKASRTVDWLLNSSRDAIKELLKRDGRSRSTSSSITESIYDQDQVVSSEKKKTTKTKTKTKKNNNNNKLVAGVRGAVGKESRQKARERARERTSQKKRLQMMTKNSTSTSAATFNEERIDDDDHNVTATRGDENNTNTLLFCTAGLGLGPWNINTSTSVFGDNATWNF